MIMQLYPLFLEAEHLAILVKSHG